MTSDIARQYALMLGAGLPALEAIQYFYPDPLEPGEAQRLVREWARTREVQDAINLLQGKSWQAMSSDERIRFAIDKHYNELAYFLYSHNYAELSGSEKQKADTCRAALEAKIAGMAGKMGAIEQFWSDVQTGRVKLAGSRPS